jgi:hypothetical protein
MADPYRHDGAHLRVSDAERHAVAEILRDAAAQGRLGLDELEERLEATYAARTYGDLMPLTADLPDAVPPRPTGAGVAPRPGGRPPARPAPAGPVPVRGSSYAVMSSVNRRGSWATDGDHTAVAFWGSIVIDLRWATWPDGLVIDAYAIMGSVEVIIDPWTVVDVSGVGFMGDFSQTRDKVPAETGPSSPRLQVRGLALMGSVNVKRRGTSERSFGQWLKDQLPPAPPPQPPSHRPPHPPR